MADRRVAVSLARPLFVGATVMLVLMAVVWGAVVMTAWGHGFDNDAYFGRDLVTRSIADGDGFVLNRAKPAVILAILCLLFVISWRRGIWRVGLAASAGAMSAWVGAEVIKWVSPWHELVASDAVLGKGLQTATYPSGHTTILCSILIALLMIVPPHWQSWFAPVTATGSVAIASAVVISGWHRPTDAVGGLLWSGAVMSVVAGLTIFWCGGERRSAGQMGSRNSSARAVLSVILGLGWYGFLWV